MEKSATRKTDPKITKKIAASDKALRGFRDLLAQDLSGYNAVVRDGVRKGTIQTFEYCVELLWKTAKAFLEEKHGIAASGSKDAFRGLLQANLISAQDCELLLRAIDERNELSYVYSQARFDAIFENLPGYLGALEKALAAIRFKPRES